MLKKTLVWVLVTISFNSHALFELKSSFYGSLLLFGRSDVIVKTHNTFLLGGDLFKFGAFYTHESIQQNTVDTAMGGAIRFGESTFFELQAGAYEREFKAHSTLKGKGVLGNLIIGKHFGSVFGISLIVTAKKITSGMDKRTMIKALPYFGLRVGI
ncbi:MAG: hypothetical protein BM556_16140 [Bacteriovorax sp. MedPE-SWde]|nr:MAG: hypothetical protein BM556_16140 [Bacteriovorax sp. MedPE-SWde]